MPALTGCKRALIEPQLISHAASAVGRFGPQPIVRARGGMPLIDLAVDVGESLPRRRLRGIRQLFANLSLHLIIAIFMQTTLAIAPLDAAHLDLCGGITLALHGCEASRPPGADRRAAPSRSQASRR